MGGARQGQGDVGGVWWDSRGHELGISKLGRKGQHRNGDSWAGMNKGGIKRHGWVRMCRADG